MPRGAVPDRYRDLLEGTALGHLATVAPSGHPQVNPVWFLRDAEHLFLSVRPGTNKYRNMRANPGVALSILDPEQPGRYVELRGVVVELELFETLEWVNQLARKYTGADFTHGKAGEPRYKVTVRIDSWTGQR